MTRIDDSRVILESFISLLETSCVEKQMNKPRTWHSSCLSKSYCPRILELRDEILDLQRSPYLRRTFHAEGALDIPMKGWGCQVRRSCVTQIYRHASKTWS